MKAEILSFLTPSILMNKLHDPPRIEEDEQEWLEAIENIYAAYRSPGANHNLESLTSWSTQNQN